ncbi:MAG: hypothetical protein IIX69_05360, partial [Clostridia bacterium]|nr:hypothetical protein [Clostridia bacterium]
MKRYITFIISLLMMFSIVPYSSAVNAAEEGIVYLDATAGNDNADGLTPATALKTLAMAITTLSNKGGKIVLTTNHSLTGSATSQYVEAKHSAKIVITADDGTKNYGTTLNLQSGMVYALNGPTEFANITINPGSGKTVIAARFNQLVMGEGVKTTSATMFILGGYQTAEANSPATKSSDITIKSGSYDTVVGFSRDRKSANITYTGTSRIKVYGGSIKTIYGASTLYHFSGSCDIRVYGGNVTSIYTGGDATRRLDGKSNIEIYGGTVSALNINNAIGDTTVILDGGSLNKITESIYQNNSTIAELASGAKRYLSYNSVSYTAEQIAKMSGKIFDGITVYGHAYVKEGANGNGKSESTPIGSLAEAIKLVASGGDVEVIGEMTVTDFTEPEHSGAIRIITDNGKLNISGTYTLSGATAFALPTSGKYSVNANGFAFRAEEGFSTSGDVTVYGTVDSTKDSSVFIGAGEIKAVYASKNGQDASKIGAIDVSGGKVQIAAASESDSTNASIAIYINGGELDKAIFDGTKGAVTLAAQLGKLGSVSAKNVAKNDANALAYSTENFDAKL